MSKKLGQIIEDLKSKTPDEFNKLHGKAFKSYSVAEGYMVEEKEGGVKILYSLRNIKEDKKRIFKPEPTEKEDIRSRILRKMFGYHSEYIVVTHINVINEGSEEIRKRINKPFKYAALRISELIKDTTSCVEISYVLAFKEVLALWDGSTLLYNTLRLLQTRARFGTHGTTSALQDYLETYNEAKGCPYAELDQVKEVLDTTAACKLKIKTGFRERAIHTVSIHFGGASLYSTHQGSYFLVDCDRQELEKGILNIFQTQLPKPASNIKEAYEVLKPDRVKEAESQGLEVTRQGEWFFIKRPDMVVNRYDMALIEAYFYTKRLEVGTLSKTKPSYQMYRHAHGDVSLMKRAQMSDLLFCAMEGEGAFKKDLDALLLNNYERKTLWLSRSLFSQFVSLYDSSSTTSTRSNNAIAIEPGCYALLKEGESELKYNFKERFLGSSTKPHTLFIRGWVIHPQYEHVPVLLDMNYWHEVVLNTGTNSIKLTGDMD